VRTCPSCGEEWASTVPVCTCGTNLSSDSRRSRRWRPSRGLLLAVLVVLAIVPGAILLTLHLLPDGALVPGGVDVPDRGREARPDELPDRRTRPNVTCEGQGVAADCMVWTFTLPRGTTPGVAVARSDDAVLVRDARNLWLLELASGEERWHLEQPDTSDGIHDVWLVGDRAILDRTTGFDVLDAATGDHVASRRLDGRLIRIGADRERIFTATTWDDEVVVTAWDPATLEVLWDTTIQVDHPVLDMHPHLAGPAGVVPDEVVVMSITTGISSDESEHQTVSLDRETGDRLEDLPGPDGEPPGFDQIRVTLEGALLRGELPPDTVVWERTLPSPFVRVEDLRDNRATLMPQDFTRITVIDATTGEDLFHVLGNGSRLRGLPFEPPWVVSVRTADAQHLVLLHLP